MEALVIIQKTIFVILSKKKKIFTRKTENLPSQSESLRMFEMIF